MCRLEDQDQAEGADREIKTRLSASAITDYRGWKDALRRSFGPPRFVEMKIGAAEIYPNLFEKE
jgi:hypothetical protein